MPHPFLEGLSGEHRQIERVLGAFDLAVDAGAAALRRARALPLDVFAASLSFFRAFADAAHHAKEEDGLFAAMVAAGAPSNRGPVACMLHGHNAGRDLIEHMAAALAALERGERGREQDLLATAVLYHDFLLEHIAREDRFIYPLAAAIVPVPIFDELERRYRDAGGADAGSMTSAADRIEALAAACSGTAGDAGPGRQESAP